MHALEAVGAVATCAPMGAGKWSKADDSPLTGAKVIVVADKDQPGRKHAADVVASLTGRAGSITTVEALVGKDAADHIAAGHGLDELVAVEVGEPSLLGGMVNGAWLDQQTFPALAWSVPGVVPEGFGLLVAQPKAGKSWMVAGLGLACAAGGRALGKIPVQRRPVLYLALEDGHRRLQSRFRTIMEGEPIPAGIDVIVKATDKEVPAIIAEWLARHPGQPPLVILDTLGKVKPPKAAGEDSYAADYKIGTRLKDLIDAVPGATLLVVHHTRKAVSDDFVDAVSGTQGIAGSADFVLVLSRKRHATDAVLAVTGRDVPEAEYALTTSDGLWTLDGKDLTAAAKAVGERKDTESLGDRSAEAFAFVNSRPMGTRGTDLAKHLDISSNDAGTYLRRLLDSGRIGRRTRGVFTPVSEVYEVYETDDPSSGSDTSYTTVGNGEATPQAPDLGLHTSSDTSYTSDSPPTLDVWRVSGRHLGDEDDQ